MDAIDPVNGDVSYTSFANKQLKVGFTQAVL